MNFGRIVSILGVCLAICGFSFNYHSWKASVDHPEVQEARALLAGKCAKTSGGTYPIVFTDYSSDLTRAYKAQDGSTQISGKIAIRDGSAIREYRSRDVAVLDCEGSATQARNGIDNVLPES